MDIQYSVTEEANKAKIGKIYKTIIDGKENGNYIGRSYLDSPEIDAGIIIKTDKCFDIGSFADVKIIDFNGYDLIGVI
ncbi:MAG: hypothetical protein LIO43_01055 [Clostridiales bacterium]|nr:hypothetical protein [Clostridiales bacterium]